MFALCVLGNVTYVGSILFYSTEKSYILMNLAWLVGSGGTLFFDFTVNTHLFINGEFVPSHSGKTFETINPVTEKVICKVAEADEKDINNAVQAAKEAYFSVWSKTTASERGRLLYKLADLMEQHTEELSLLESLDNGKTVSDAKNVDIPGAIGCYRYYAGWADKIHGKVIPTSDLNQFSYTRHEPIGVVGCIIPWNFPVLMQAWKLGPALATGNTVVIKLAEQTPLTGLYIARLIKEAGFPPGVVNVINGFGKVAGVALASHPDVHKIAFTGSTVTGRAIMKAAADSNIKKVSLELGGKSPNIIFADADIDKAVQWSSSGIYFNHGQCCSAGSRIYVQESIYDEFLEKFKKHAQSIQLGDPFDSKTTQGPQVSKLQFDRIMDYIELGKKEGATCELGGKRWGEVGYYIQPTIFTNVNENMKIMKEEIFGPVVAICKFKDENDALEKANASAYGLAAAVFTTDMSKAIKMSNELQAGTVWVNCYNVLDSTTPFGGYKESGFGRELGKYALSLYTQIKTVKMNVA
ncbi:aldehyde dehydrogenase [Basidiobolus meristosporus CBS 931.73]|uniref:Aldehyde dehydrogenase n=1 Tax=Basidiobolus meristosporus CBS 931.73 TaxID=1314790 RepID=A0A1Y1Y8Y9_9FUNG|nr:aldehyde dehydrogenase [Basidiobolus meristosporus CBS 931.73]|eukprot:ORX94438.1 aldehyde dehydrogenase [Basidiobolus meristosporus CBS 931.73]